MSNCGLCRGHRWIKEYEDTWPCPSCNPQHEFTSVLGCRYVDCENNTRECWQMVSKLDGYAYAICDLVNGKVDRFIYSDSFQTDAEEWQKEILNKPVIQNQAVTPWHPKP